MQDAPSNPSDVEIIDRLRIAREKLKEQISRVIVGQEEVVDKVLIALFCQGHSLMIGVPGLAKTLLVKTISRILHLKFQRIQFTPDLMPSDIIGTDVIEDSMQTGRREFRFIRGPVFANIILADEINRTPPKTQAALLEAMEEHEVTAGGTTYKLDEPFFVLATQNPIEQEGTYPLPEAQLDRFMFNIHLTYPDRESEEEIVRRTTAGAQFELEPVLDATEVIDIQKVVRKIPASDAMISYAVGLVAQTRPSDSSAPEFVRNWIRWGAGPRASQYLILGAKARSVLRGNYFVSAEDIKAVAHEVLGHRLVTNFQAESEGITSRDIIQRLLDETQSPSG
jgi:MoxR-like ATPase